MATRAIVTSLPDVACDVCGRRLLRGEHPEVFLAGLERRLVCELCAPRAVHEGWMREQTGESLNVPAARRRRRGVSLLGRLRQLREPVRRPAGAEEPDLSEEALEDAMQSAWAHETVRFSPTRREPAARAGAEIERIVELFNMGEHPRRVAGVARSLGDPSVTVRLPEGCTRRYTIVVAWELCWYRYEVDLDDEQAGARLLEKGMELDELPGEDRVPNAVADERGELALAA